MRHLSLVVIISVLFICCGKKDSGTVTKPPAGFTFTTSYDSVYSCYPNSNVTLSFTINVESGDITSNPVTYTITGLPPNVTVTPATQTVGGVLGGAFTITLGNVPKGADTAKLIISSAATGTETHKIIFNVHDPVDNAPMLAATYNHCYDYCQPTGFFYYSSVVATVPDTPYLVRISNVRNLGTGVGLKAWISNVVQVPVQWAGAYKVWGSGHYFKDTGSFFRMEINDTMVSGTDTQYSVVHIEQ